MFTKIARLIRRRSIRVNVESTQDAREQIVVEDELQPQLELELEREVVDTAPDLLRWCSLETPFPSVAFGGYVRYYRAHPATTHFIVPVTPPPLSNNISSSPLSSKSPESPTKTMQEAESLKTARKARRYSFSNSFSISEKSPQLFRWKRATCIISSSIAEHNLFPLFSQSPNSADAAHRPSFEMARPRPSSSSSSSKGSSDSSSPPDSIAFAFRHTSPDSVSTLSPNSPTSIYSNNEEEDGIMVESPNLRCSGLGTSRTWLGCRPISSSSYGTVETALSQG